MIYRFDSDWNGEVIAEEAEEGMELYMGLKFPASDIPKQARELYKVNPYRLIPNVEYSPIRLYPILNPLSNTFTNLSNSNLRSVAAVHLEYLRNMRVTASMSTRILKNGELWGLIACHHRTAKYLSYQTCSVFEMLSNIISAKISSVENADMQGYIAGQQGLLRKIVEGVYRQDSLENGLRQQENDLKALFGAGGVAIVSGKRTIRIGQTPGDAAIHDLVYWLQSRSITTTFQETSLSAQYEEAIAYADIASGLLALPIQPEKGGYVLAFRPEDVREVEWSGNPAEAVQFEPRHKTYHPRASFAIWQQKVLNTAPEWSAPDLEIAEAFRAFVIEYMLNKG
jgi:light-regulated signal transduction histidine kinase (bacteriophytochrome)